MDLLVYLSRNRYTGKEIAKNVGVTPTSIYTYKHKVRSPNLITAIKLLVESEGKVQLNDLLSYEDEKKLEKWLIERNSRKDPYD